MHHGFLNKNLVDLDDHIQLNFFYRRLMSRSLWKFQPRRYDVGESIGKLYYMHLNLYIWHFRVVINEGPLDDYVRLFHVTLELASINGENLKMILFL
jgi:hypothetical protein